ncbi:DUF4418 family protein [Clostridium tepidum]|uniref:DUF4418 domain-containing protein n=2 Tax=Clostridium tepidum TaxID=1962263 RepID=A0ABX3L3S6_9CLOT|nr:DUF4418 family protein [Clostridium tepidum]MDU6877532.1 DUF4418 family protein [Clostridium botulinum]OOO62095.1 hypothetical protein BS637_08175 [Clostridium tepidum]
MKRKIISVISILLSILLAIGPWTLFKACPTTKKVMKCHWCCKAIIPIAIILIIIGIFQLVSKNNESLKILNIIAAVCFIMPILLTTILIGGCMKAEMACNVVTFPIINTLSVIGIIINLIGLFSKFSTKEV